MSLSKGFGILHQCGITTEFCRLSYCNWVYVRVNFERFIADFVRYVRFSPQKISNPLRTQHGGGTFIGTRYGATAIFPLDSTYPLTDQFYPFPRSFSRAHPTPPPPQAGTNIRVARFTDLLSSLDGTRAFDVSDGYFFVSARGVNDPCDFPRIGATWMG